MANIPSSRRLLSLITMDNTDMNRGKVACLADAGRPKRLNADRYPAVVQEFLDSFLKAMLSQKLVATAPHRPSAPVHSSSATARAASFDKAASPLFKIPSPVAAVAAAIENENPAVTGEDARRRAEALVDEALAKRRSINEMRRATAQSSSADVAARKQSRIAREVWA